MKYSQQWIQTFLNVPLETQSILHTLTMAGLEVDGTEQSSTLLFPDNAQMSEPDTLIEIDITPNRGDCLSITGLARECAVLLQCDYQAPAISKHDAQFDESFSIRCEAPQKCPRYVGRIIKNIDATVNTPKWIVDRLQRAEIRDINPVVDILNYVMIELGQPMHAFDADTIQGSVIIREAQSGETITLLDEQQVTLQAGTLLITDESNPLAIAGIMGGLDSGVTPKTTQILLESALFAPDTQQGQARLYGLHTDSSFRFERGVDPQLQQLAIDRASDLILQICGGEPGPIQTIEESQYLPAKQPILLRTNRVEKVIGVSLSQQQMVTMLSRIGCQCDQATDSASVKEPVLNIVPPTHRYDLNIEIDLIEELARIYGYENIPTELPMMRMTKPVQQEEDIADIRLKHALVDMGYIECINYSFTDSVFQSALFPDSEAMALLNPISQDSDVMRVSLLPGLLKNLQFNTRRQQDRCLLFELGHVYVKNNGAAQQTLKLAGIGYGQIFAETWRQEQRSLDFFDVKGHVSMIWQLTGQAPLCFKPADNLLAQKGIAAQVYCDNQIIGCIGKLNPTLQKQLDIDENVYWFELDAEPFLHQTIRKLSRPSKFPEIRRDIAVIVDNDVPSQTLVDYIYQSATKWLQSINIFDEYKGKGITPGRKSVGLGLILQDPSRTLVDEEVNTLMQTIIEGLKKDFSAELRD